MSSGLSTVTVNDGVTWDQVKSRVIAVGVALLFVYIVTSIISRSILDSKHMGHSSRRKKERKSVCKNCWKLLKCFIGLGFVVSHILT